ncbi:MAG: helical backbone metal receptor [Burkholderiaceae bacterium]
MARRQVRRWRVAFRAWARFAASFSAIATLTAAAVAATAPSISITDDRGVTVQFTQPPQRIVTLLPSLTESVCELDACGRIVGTDRFSNWPQSVQVLPKLGGLDDAQVERLYALKPDVVLAAKSARVLDRLEALGLKVLALESQSLSDVRRTVRTVATLLGSPPAGDRLLARIDVETQTAAARIPADWRGAQVYFEISATPHAAGASSFIGELLVQLGLDNVVPPSLGPFPKLNPEYVVRAKPDLIMASVRNLDGMSQRPGWDTIPALTAGHACGFDAANYELLIRPGPRLGEAAAALADCVAGLPPRGAAR